MFTSKIADDFNSDKIKLSKISTSENFTALISVKNIVQFC